MEGNMFENAKFGDKYKDRDGNEVLYLFTRDDERVFVIGRFDDEAYVVLLNGKVYEDEDRENPFDIAGRWEETINYDHLDEIQHDYCEVHGYLYMDEESNDGITYPLTKEERAEMICDAIQYGYEKAMEEMRNGK